MKWLVFNNTLNTDTPIHLKVPIEDTHHRRGRYLLRCNLMTDTRKELFVSFEGSVYAI